MADFYFDHNLHRRIATGLRTAGHAVVTAQEWGYAELADDRQLWVATRARRILLTYDDDLRRIHREWGRRKGLLGELPEHHGIIVAPAPPIWRAEQAVREVVVLLGQRASLVGECYEWGGGGTWVRVERGSGDDDDDDDGP